MRTWKELDDTNWEVRNGNYTKFDLQTSPNQLRKPLFLSAVQIMKCPMGSVQGGVFCMKCPPGTQYNDDKCSLCRHGYYTDRPGMTTCQACPGFKTTELVGMSDGRECMASDAKKQILLLALGPQALGVLRLKNLEFDMLSLPSTGGNLDRMAYSPRDRFIYYSTQQPTTICNKHLTLAHQYKLVEFSGDTIITGIAVDERSGLVIYTTYQGILGAFDPLSGAKHILKKDLIQPRDLTLDQNFGIFWVEGNDIKYMKYDGSNLKTVASDRYAVWNPTIDFENDQILWNSYKRLRSHRFTDGIDQILANGFTSNFGFTSEYYFYIDIDGQLIRVNKDLSAKTSVYSTGRTVNRMESVLLGQRVTAHHPCDPSGEVCEHGCYPVNTTSWECFCREDYMLQKDLKTCRPDFSVILDTSDYQHWEIPKAQDYEIPPSQTLRFKVKACHSAKLALVEQGKRLYQLDIGQKRGNVTEAALRKQWTSGPKVLLRAKEAKVLDCNSFQPFWITWKNKILKFGPGEVVGANPLLIAEDARPFTVNYIQFGIGQNSTATWQF